MSAPWRRWGLASRILTATTVVVAVGALSAWAVASIVGPAIFHVHLLRGGASDPSVVQHSEEAFASASAYSLGVALFAALATSVIVSLLVTRRITRQLGQVQYASGRIAAGDYTVQVPSVGMGAELDDLASAFNTMSAELGRVEQTRTRLLSDLAHEMRTPVATLEGFLEGIQDGVVQADEETVRVLLHQVSRLARLAQDIALVTTAEEGRLSMHRRPVRADALIETAVSQASGRYAAAGVDLIAQIADAAVGTVVEVDQDRIGQVLTNLLDNALRHTSPGGQVVVRAERDQSCVRLLVIDDGEGIASEHLGHVFERFYRADTARDRAHGGSGIGLAIARSISRAHGGDVTVTSAGYGQGATFTVELPVMASIAERQRQQRQARCTRSPAPGSQEAEGREGTTDGFMKVR